MLVMIVNRVPTQEIPHTLPSYELQGEIEYTLQGEYDWIQNPQGFEVLLPCGVTPDSLSLRRYQLHSNYVMNLSKIPEKEEYKKLIISREQQFIG